MMNISEDNHWMRLALKEAQRSTGLTSPNPAVGAIIVRDGIVIARGRTRQVGGNHAERDALSILEAGEAKGATIYVTLEPCSTRGRSGACTDAIIAAGISRVVYGLEDPNPSHAGRADGILNAAGIEVERGICEEECRHQIRGFISVQTKGRPWVIAKTAMSLDGKISRPNGEGQWLSNEQSRERVHLLRGEVDAIVTSGETVRRDNPSLTIRSPQISEEKEQPLRVVLTKCGLDQSQWKLFNDEYKNRTRVFENIKLQDVLFQLSKNEGINTVMLECGGSLMGAFLDSNLIDEFMIFYAPMMTGGPHCGIGGEGISGLEDRWGLENPSIEQIGNDLCLRGLVSTESQRELER